MKKINNGFSLIELMIVVTIVGILASIAYPGYQDYIRRTRYAKVMSSLLEFSQAMELHYSTYYTYLGSASGDGDTGAPAAAIFAHSQTPYDGEALYQLVISAATTTSYTLSAIPVIPDICGIFTLTQSGEKGDGSGGSARCWQ